MILNLKGRVLIDNPRTVQFDGATFIINSFSRADAKETQAQLLRRAILRNAEKELRSSNDQRELKAGYSTPEPGFVFCRSP